MPDSKPKQVPLTNREINVLITLLTNSVPSVDDQPVVVNIIDKLWMMLRL